jgi:recombination protein RecT
MSTNKKGLMLANQKTITGLLEQMKGEIARCLPKHLSPERMARIAMTELRKNTKLSECDPMSFIAAIMQASQLGLEPGILGSCYLIPFFNSKLGKYECTFMPGYRGFLDLARRSGQITSLIARAVYANDVFEYEFGLKENIIHKPCMDDRGALVAVYAVALLKDGGHQFEVMSKREIDLIKDKSQGKNGTPWTEYYDEMARKTVLRKLFKWLPCSVEMQKAVSLDELQEIGKQNIKAAASEEFNMDFVIDAEPSTDDAKEELKALVEKNKAAPLMVDPETGEELPAHLQSNASQEKKPNPFKA